jgi:hypothetical protein
MAYVFCVNNAWKLLVFFLKECRKPPASATSLFHDPLQCLEHRIFSGWIYTVHWSLVLLFSRLLPSTHFCQIWPFSVSAPIVLVLVSLGLLWAPLQAYVWTKLFTWGSICLLVPLLTHSSTLKKEAVRFSDSSAKFYRTTEDGVRLSNSTLQILSFIHNNNFYFRNLSRSFWSFPDILKKTYNFLLSKEA